MKKKLIAALTALTAACVAVTSLAAYAAYRDPDGYSGLTASDALYVQQFLAGRIPTYNLNAMDVDQNGIISEMDSDKILHYLTNKDNPILPEAPAGDDTTTLKTIETRTYRKHNYSSSNSTSYSSYTINESTINSATSGNITNPDCMPMKIIGNNNMIRDTDTAVVKLSIGGTGFIVGDHVIATAAHCVYNNGFIDNTIEIVDENNNVINSFHAESVHIPDNYVISTAQNVKNRHDYALLYVPSVDLSEYGMFSLGIATDGYLNNTNNQVIVSGFPQKYPNEYPDGNGDAYGLRFKASGSVQYNGDPYRLSYNADTAGGDSGGPVYVEEGFKPVGHPWNEYKTVIGINTHESRYYDYNLGVRIIPELLAFYNNNKNL